MSSMSHITIQDEENSSSIDRQGFRRIRCLLQLIAWIGLLSFATRERAQAFSYMKSPPAVWTNGIVSMVLKLGSAGRTLIDGNTLWDTVAAGALTDWNSHLGTLQLSASPQSFGNGAKFDGTNQAFFSSKYYGQSFGAGVLAVTLFAATNNAIFETDVIINTAFSWDSYSGSLRSPGGQPLYDLGRVVLHEFGHVLGLTHPDQAGQTVSAIMNSTIGNVDSLKSDDIAGAKSLYPQQIATIMGQPQSQTVTIGSTVTFSVIAMGSQPLSYQWKRNGVNISGATSATYTISNVQTSKAGNYTVVVGNTIGNATSTSAVLTVDLLAQTITFGSLPDKRMGDAPFTLSATASSGLAVSYTSSASGVATVSGNTVTIRGIGSTTITASQAGNATYQPAVSVFQTLGVTPLGITSQPVDVAVNVTSNATFGVTALSASPLSYQWRKNGVNVSGATSASLALSNVQTNQAGSYTVVITNV